jgi:DNA-binding beta-propeller fold protein YncE
LTHVVTFPTGTQPFNVAIEPLGKFAYVTNQADDTVSAFAINAVSGALTPVGTYATGLNPIGIAAGRVAAGSLR